MVPATLTLLLLYVLLHLLPCNMFVLYPFFVWLFCCLFLFNTFFICFSWTRPCYVLIVKSFAALVSVLHCRQAAKRVSFVEPSSARAAQVAATPLWQRPAARAATAAAGRTATLASEPVWLAYSLAQTYLSASLSACAAYRTLSVCQGRLSCDAQTNDICNCFWLLSNVYFLALAFINCSTLINNKPFNL